MTATVVFAIRGPSSEAAPAGMFTASPSQLTIPAGGVGQMTITTITNTTDPVGDYSGIVQVSVNGAAAANVPAAIEVEPERFNLTVGHVDDLGNPSTDYFTMLMRTDIDDTRYLPSPAGR